MKYMLDTNICILAINGNPSVRLRFIREYLFGLTISAITEAELWYGIENSASRERNSNILFAFLATVVTLSFDSLAAVEYGHVRAELKRAGTPIGDRDTLIAAHAKSAGLTLVTNNTQEFGRVKGLALEDWKFNLNSGI